MKGTERRWEREDRRRKRGDGRKREDGRPLRWDDRCARTREAKQIQTSLGQTRWTMKEQREDGRWWFNIAKSLLSKLLISP